MTMTRANNISNQESDDAMEVFSDISITSNIYVLIVDDDPDLRDMTASFLEREREEFNATTVAGGDEALEYIDGNHIDAIVSDYDMPSMNGIELLENVRDKYQQIPFILFTGKGSEEIASEAISKGVTDYLQKGMGTSQYSLLANRLINAVEQNKALQNLEKSQEKFSKLVKNSSDMVGIVNDSGVFEYISPACEQILGYTQEELIGENAFDYMPPDDRKNAMEEFFETIEQSGSQTVITHRFKQKDGGTTILETRGRNMFDDDFINGFVVNGRDISEIKEREQKLKQQNEQLENLKKVITHDITNPLNIISSSIDLYRETGDEEYLEKVQTAAQRIDTLLDQVTKISDQKIEIETTEQVALDDVARSAWEMVETNGSEMHIDNSKTFEADPSQTQQIFENLFQNAIEHNSSPVTVYVGTTESTIYLEDDGKGIPEDDTDKIFELGHTTEPENTGFGLSIIKQIVIGHGWELEAKNGEAGGARFEIKDVTFQPRVYS